MEHRAQRQIRHLGILAHQGAQMRSPPDWVERHLHGHREHLEWRLNDTVFAPGVEADVAAFPPIAATGGDALLALGPKPVQIRKVDVTRFRPSQASGPCKPLSGWWFA